MAAPEHRHEAVLAVLAEATDVSMGIGDIGAVLLIAILLIFSFVICYRLTGHLPGPTDGSNVRGFFWTTAMLGQTVASACADWVLDPGGPPERVAIAVIALGIAATIGLYLFTRVPRAVLFWSAFVLSGTVAALGGHFVMKSIECSAQHVGASCRFSATGPINQTAGWSKAILARIEPGHSRQSPIPRGITKTDFGSEGNSAELAATVFVALPVCLAVVWNDQIQERTVLRRRGSQSICIEK
jgi:hypothetical protein